MGAMCKFDFPIGRLRGVGEYVMYVVNAAQGTKGLRVKVYTTPGVGTPGTGHACSSLCTFSLASALSFDICLLLFIFSHDRFLCPQTPLACP